MALTEAQKRAKAKYKAEKVKKYWSNFIPPIPNYGTNYKSNQTNKDISKT
jgi:hypothetical protein